MNKNEVEINAKVQLSSDKNIRGSIVATSSRKNKDDVIVEWEDGDVSPVDPKSLELVPPANTKLQDEFENLCVSIGEQIHDKVKKAEDLLNEACMLADEHGIPFFTNVSLLGQPYVPESFQSKWCDLERDFVANLTEVATYDLVSAYGWSHSQVC